MTDDLIFQQSLHPDRRLRRAELLPCRDHSGPDYPGHQVLELASASSGNVTAMCVEPPDVELLQETFRPAGTPGLAETIAVLRYGLAHAVWNADIRKGQSAEDKARAIGTAYGYARALTDVLAKMGKGQEIAKLDWHQIPGELPLPQGAARAARAFLGTAADSILGQETP